MKSAVFLDRDGTMIEDVGYLDALARVAFYPWTVDAIRMLNRSGLAVVVVTNQAGIARGIFDAAFVAETHRFIDARLAAAGARIDAYYYCPHHPDGRIAEYARACECRKPGPGMIEQAARDLDLDPRRSFMVGDK
jgi:D-glycero-D-manno-heptose 1,7-bisphosphate phosphatase